MFDGTTETFEGISRADTVVAMALTAENKFLVLDQEQPHKGRFRSLPGGRVDPGEDPLSAAKRELAEETGYNSENWQLWKQTRPFTKIDWTIHVFVARNCYYKQEPKLDPGERINLGFMNFREFKKFALSREFPHKEIQEELWRQYI